MTAFDEAIAVEGADGQYSADLSPDYRTMVAPFGGYIAAVLLRTAGAHSSLPKPASMYCHFLNAADSAPVDLEVATRRKSSRAEAMRVTMRQSDKLIAEAMVWMIGNLEGADHVSPHMPSAPPPEACRTFQELYENYPAGFGFMEGRPIFEWPLDKPRPGAPPWPMEELMARIEPLPPFVRGWVRLTPKATFDDPIVDAARVVLPLDWMPVGATQMPHAGKAIFAQSLDFSVAFHESAPTSEWLYCEGESPIALGGVVNAAGRVWSQNGKLLATGHQQAFQRIMDMQQFLNREG